MGSKFMATRKKHWVEVYVAFLGDKVVKCFYPYGIEIVLANKQVLKSWRTTYDVIRSKEAHLNIKDYIYAYLNARLKMNCVGICDPDSK